MRLADEVRGQFVMAHDEFGSGIAYSSDTLIVFYDEVRTKVLAITPATFRWLTGEFYVLKGQLYHGPFKLGKIDAEAIRGHTTFYVWDDQTVFYLNGPVLGADAHTFEDLGCYWARDSGKVFFQEKLIRDADRASFRVFDDTFAVDSKHIFTFAGRIVSEYREDPIMLGDGYYVVSGKVFFGGTEIPSADVKTFKLLPTISPEEKKEIWATGGPKTEEQALAVSGFTGYDARQKYKGGWSTPHKKRA